ncbi:hypothetical protein M2140_001328 [Clostridiales Family XIII bacterium PM5-7]
MEIIKVGIVSNQDEFVHALVKGLARNSRGMSFCILNSVEDGADCQMILSTEKIEDQRCVHLSVVREDNCQVDGPPYRLYRYEDCQMMTKQLLFIFFSMTGRIVESGLQRNCKILVITSECGGAGATSLSISLGRALFNLYGYRSLYLNLCPINDGYKFLPNPQFNYTKKLFYYLDMERSFPLEPFISSADQLDYISTDYINRHLHDLSSEIMLKLIGKIEDIGRYTYLIVDIGNHLTRENQKLMDCASHTVLLHDSRRSIPESMRCAIREEVKARTTSGEVIIVHNFAKDQWEGDCEEELFLEEKGDAFFFQKDDRIQINLKHGYGMGIAAIAKRIVEEVNRNEVQ